MRRISPHCGAPIILGTLGGAAGLGVHAALLIRFFSQSHGLFRVFLDIALATALGLAALLVTTLSRRSLRTLAVLLPVLGALGFVPRPISWAPAGSLLVAAGVAAGTAVLRDKRSCTAKASAMTAGGRPLHWSEAARLGISPSPPRPRAGGRGSWSPRCRAAVVAGAVVAVIIVIPLSLWSYAPGSGADESNAAPSASTTTTLAVALPGSATPSPKPPATTTTDQGALDSYVNRERGFSMYYPREWRNTDPSEVGERTYGGRNQAIEKQYERAFVPAAFANWSGPTYDGCYLDYIWIESYDDIPPHLADLAEIRADTEEWLDWVLEEYSDVKLLEPVRDVRLGIAHGFLYQWSFPLGSYRLVLMDCALVANDAVYFLQFAAVEDDWDEYGPVFEQVLESFTVHGSSPVI